MSLQHLLLLCFVTNIDATYPYANPIYHSHMKHVAYHFIWENLLMAHLNPSHKLT